MIKNVIIVSVLILLAFLLYSYRLDSVPPGVYVDEAVSVVNANSILKTGNDEYGKSFPVLFRFFGSYSPPLYVYLTTIPIFFLGMNEYSARIVSVIFGSLMVLIVYQLLKNNPFVDKKILILLLIFFILTPWNFFYARTGYEIYIGFFLYSLGVLLLWRGLKNSLFLILGLIVLSISVYGSHAQFYSIPITIFLFLLFFYKLLNKKIFLFGLLFAFLIQLPRLSLFNTKALLNKGDLFYLTEITSHADKMPLPVFLSIPLSFLYSFFARFFYYFSPESLFLSSDPDPQRSIPEISVFYSWMVIPYLLGWIVVFLNLKNNFIKFLLIIILSVVIPACLTLNPFSSQRGLPLLLPLFLIVSFGISVISKKISLRLFLPILILLIGISGVIFWRSYFVLLPAERAITWNYGYKELARIIKENPNAHFVVEQNLDKPGYIELAFFLKTNPEVLQKAVDQNIKEDYYNLTQFNSSINFENIQMKNIVWETDIYKPQILVADEKAISPAQAKEHFLTEQFRIKDPRGYPVFIGYLTDPKAKCLSINFSNPNCSQPEDLKQ